MFILRPWRGCADRGSIFQARSVEMASLLRRGDDLQRLRVRELTLQQVDGGFAGVNTVMRFVSAQGDVGESEMTIDGSNNVVIPGNALISDGLDVSGDAAVGGNLDVSGDAAIDGNANVGGELDVSGDASVGGTLDVSGDAAVGGNLDVSGDASVGGTLDVSGDAVVDGNTSVGGNLDVSGDAVVDGNTSVGGNLDVSGDATIDGNTSVGGNLDVSGDAVVDGNTSVGGNLDVSGDATIDGSASVGGNLDVSGDATIDGSASVGGNLDVSGDATIDGSASVGGNLDVSGDTAMSGRLDVSGNVTSGGTYTAAGDILSNGGLSRLSTNAPNVGTCEIYSTEASGVGPQFQAYKSRGGTGAVQSGDQLGIVNFFGRDSSGNFGTASAQILATAAGSFTSSSRPANLTLRVCKPGETAVTDSVQIFSDKQVDITSQKVQIIGDVAGVPVFGMLRPKTGGVATNDEIGRMLFVGQRNDGAYSFAAARISSFAEGSFTAIPDSHPGNLVFSTSPANDPNNYERMRITSTGNVGIGTTAPGKRLEVNGDAMARGTLYVGGDISTNEIRFRGTTFDGDGQFNHTILSERIYSGTENSELLLYKGNDGTDRIRLKSPGIVLQTVLDTDVNTYTNDSAGNFFIFDSNGDTSLPRHLDVSGNVVVDGNLTVNGTITFGVQTV
jgi:predicted acyltransferase (DUF342 family)